MRTIKEIVVFIREKLAQGYTYDWVRDYAQTMPERQGFVITEDAILMYVGEGIIVYSYGSIEYYLRVGE